MIDLSCDRSLGDWGEVSQYTYFPLYLQQGRESPEEYWARQADYHQWAYRVTACQKGSDLTDAQNTWMLQQTKEGQRLSQLQRRANKEHEHRDGDKYTPVSQTPYTCTGNVLENSTENCQLS